MLNYFCCGGTGLHLVELVEFCGVRDISGANKRTANTRVIRVCRRLLETRVFFGDTRWVREGNPSSKLTGRRVTMNNEAFIMQMSCDVKRWFFLQVKTFCLPLVRRCFHLACLSYEGVLRCVVDQVLYFLALVSAVEYGTWYSWLLFTNQLQ
jgi:hypothetical protein